MKISAKSKIKIRRLFTPPTDKTQKNLMLAGRGIPSIRQFLHTKRFRRLHRVGYTMLETVDGHLLSIANLRRDGFDHCG